MSNTDRRDENGDFQTALVKLESMRKTVYSVEDLDSNAKINKKVFKIINL